MENHFWEENDKRINKYLQRVLLILLVPFILFFIFSCCGRVNEVSDKYIMIYLIIIIALLVPHIMYIRNKENRLFKYVPISVISLLACAGSYMFPSYACIALLISMTVSILYLDVILTLFAAVLSYIFIVLTFFLRMGLSEHFDLLMGITVEFFIAAPVIIFITGTVGRHVKENQSELKQLKEANDKYVYAIKGSSEVLYEYDVEADVLTYFGPLFEIDFEKCVEPGERVVIEHYYASIQRNGMLPPQDLEELEDFVKNGTKQIIQFRVISEDKQQWIELTGNRIYNDGKLYKLVGKANNVTLKKLEEQQFLKQSGHDSKTGFYDRNVGIKILKEHVTETGRTDNATYLYISLENISEIGTKAGLAYKDAIILRVADILKLELSDMDLPIYISEGEFLLYLTNRNAAMLEHMISRITKQIEYIHTGELLENALQVKIEAVQSFKEVLSFVQKESETYILAANENSNDDIFSFAFNLLDRSIDFDASMNLLLERIGGIYGLDVIRVLRNTSNPGKYRCIYEWISYDCVEEEVSRLNDTMGVGGLEEKVDVFLAECNDNNMPVGYVSYQGLFLSRTTRESIVTKLTRLSDIINNFLVRKQQSDFSEVRMDILSDLSQEIRVPMNMISGLAELIISEEPDAIIEGYAESVAEHSELLQEVIDDILHLSEIQTGRVDLTEERYYLHTIVEEVRDRAAIRSAGKSIELLLNCNSKLPDGFIGDRMKIHMILMKLVCFCIEQMTEGQIGIELSWVPGKNSDGSISGVIWAAFEGFEEDLNFIFERRYHGLTLAKALIKMQKGSITAEKSSFGGIKFRFSIPQQCFSGDVYNYDSGEFNEQSEKHSLVPFTAPWSRILIVDDEQVSLDLFESILGSYKSMISTAQGGAEALSILTKDSDYDVIFMDYDMPVKNGIEISQEIRGSGDPTLEKIPIIMLLDAYSESLKEEMDLAGIDMSLTKPINLRELADVMSKYIAEEKREIV